MPEIVPMPKLGFDMAEGRLVRQVKKDGETVAKGDLLAEIETDKATVEVEATASGVVKGWLAEEGQAVPVGAAMVVIGAANEDVDLAAYRTPPGEVVRPAASATAAGSVARPFSPSSASPAPTQPASPGVSSPASPIARKMASDAGIDLHLISGSGPGGRITKKDVEAYLRASVTREAVVTSAASSAADTVVPLTRLRQIIARRMTEAQQTVPQFYVTSEIDMAAAMALRKQINDLLPDERRVSVNALVVKAAGLALREFPNLNASFAGDKVISKGRVNIGLAVAV